VAKGASPGPRFELKIAKKVSNLRGSVQAEQATKLEALRSNQEALQKELADTQKDRDRLRDFQETQSSQIEDLIQEKTSLGRELAELRTRIERLSSQNTALQENADRLTSQVDTLANEKATLRQQHEQAVVALRSQMLAQRQEYENLVRNSETQEKELQSELELERDRARQLREHLGGLERLSNMRAKEIAQLTAKVDRARAALQTPFGKGFVLLSRLLGGADLSDL
jgi:chromosome segregation ATPase